MRALGAIFLIIGGIAYLGGGIWTIVLAFKKSVLWGLGAIFVPFVSLVFAILNWSVAKKPFLIAITGFVLLGIGAVLIGAGAPQEPVF
ncbi:MAG: hypothetical protein ACRDIF_02185 [Actinomycetota bacterium]